MIEYENLRLTNEKLFDKYKEFFDKFSKAIFLDGQKI